MIKFTYTKADGSTSERVFAEIYRPNRNHFGVDLSPLDEEDQALFEVELESIRERFNKDLATLMEEFDVEFRQFIPERMTDIVQLEV